jgi:hypothetical protein
MYANVAIVPKKNQFVGFFNVFIVIIDGIKKNQKRLNHAMYVPDDPNHNLPHYIALKLCGCIKAPNILLNRAAKNNLS